MRLGRSPGAATSGIRFLGAVSGFWNKRPSVVEMCGRLFVVWIDHIYNDKSVLLEDEVRVELGVQLFRG